MTTWETLNALSHALELFGIDRSTNVILFSSAASPPDLLETARMGVARSQAAAVEVKLIESSHSQATSLVDAPMVTSALNNADMIINCTPLDLGAGATAARVLQLHPHAEQAAQFPPHANLRSRVESLSKDLKQAKTISLSDGAGHELSISLEGATISHDHGMPSNAGEHGSFPSGWAQVQPAAGAVSGEMLITAGDANLAAGVFVNSALRLKVRDDHIVAIRGESGDGDALRALLERAGDPHAFGFAGLTIGCNPRKQHEDGPYERFLLDPLVAQLTAGVVTVAFGDNATARRPCQQTVSFALTSRWLSCDDQIAVANGVLQGIYAPDVYEIATR